MAKEIYSEKVSGIRCDITNNSDIDAAVVKVLNHFGKFDTLVNCAGVALLNDAENLSEQYWQKNVDLNLTASFAL